MSMNPRADADREPQPAPPPDTHASDSQPGSSHRPEPPRTPAPTRPPPVHEPLAQTPSPPPPPVQTPSDEQSAPEPSADEAQERPGTDWRRLLPWVVVLLAVAVAVVSTVQWLSLRGDAADRRAIATVTSETVMTLTNWDADELDAVGARLGELGTDRLQEEAIAILEAGAEALVAARASSSGEILDLVTEAGRGEGIAFALVQQRLESEELGTPPDVCWSVRVISVEEGGRWLADRIDIFEGECP